MKHGLPSQLKESFKFFVIGCLYIVRKLGLSEENGANLINKTYLKILIILYRILYLPVLTYLSMSIAIISIST